MIYPCSPRPLTLTVGARAIPPASAPPTILWFRQDLRLADNAALCAAAATGPVIPVFIWDTTDPVPPGGAARWWLHHSLTALAGDLGQAGMALVMRRGDATAILDELVETTGACSVCWNRCYEPHAMARDGAIASRLERRGIRVQIHNGALLHEPTGLLTAAGTPYRMFTPFWRALQMAGDPAPPTPAPRLAPFAGAPMGDAIEAWQLLPRGTDWSGGLRANWRPGEAGARRLLADFLDDAVLTYDRLRDRPDLAGTSHLSPHLHWGEISPRQVWHGLRARMAQAGDDRGWGMLRQLGWREFAYHLLAHNPTCPDQPLRPAFADFPWRTDPHALRAWQRGHTGYPMVDAAMRALWQTGWLHNRARMVVASFLTKHLMQDWRHGAAWFHDTLVDADLANNTAGWQWAAGCGIDAAPYFRIFNPTVQGETWDPQGAYIRRFVPELARLPDRWLHRPWQAPVRVLADAGVTLDRTYPQPIVDHSAARVRALAAFAAIKRAA